MSQPMHAFDRITPTELRRRGSLKWTRYPEQVLPVWIAEMDFPSATPIVEAMSELVKCEAFGYAPDASATDLPQATADWHSTDIWRVDPDRVHVVPDVVRAIHVAIEEFTAPGSAIVVPSPAYMPFFGVAQMLGRPVIDAPMMSHGDVARLNLPAIEAGLAAGAQSVILCQPHNPLGAVFSRSELVELSDIVQRYGARVVSDEIHSPLVYPGRSHVPYASVSSAAAEHTITAVSASKAWNLAGLNCAQVIVHNAEDQQRWQALSMMKTHGASPTGITASIAAYRHGGQWLAETLSYLDGNRRLLGELLSEHLPEVRYRAPDATYLAWLDFRELQLDTEPADFFVEAAQVAMSAGHPFGPNGRGYARFNFATSRSIIEQAVTDMAAAVKRHRPSKNPIN